MNKQPKLMDFSRMRDIFSPHLEQIRKNIFMDSELVILHGDPKVFQLIMLQNPPFTINDHRLGIVVKGEVHLNVNLVEKKISAGTLVFIGPGSIISPIGFSPDLEIFGIGLSTMPFASGQMPQAFNGQVRDFQLQVSEADIATARHIIETLWHIVHQKNHNRQTVSSLIAAQMYLYDGLYSQHADRLQNSQTRNQTIFDRFIYLINQHCQHERHIRFYAEKMCLTERYLGTVIRQASGVTAKEWIDRAVTTRIKIELKHTDKSIVQISEDMNFPNPSFFSKYFRRLTGETPLEYKQSASH